MVSGRAGSCTQVAAVKLGYGPAAQRKTALRSTAFSQQEGRIASGGRAGCGHCGLVNAGAPRLQVLRKSQLEANNLFWV